MLHPRGSGIPPDSATPCGSGATRCRETDCGTISSDGRRGIDPLGWADGGPRPAAARRWRPDDDRTVRVDRACPTPTGPRSGRTGDQQARSLLERIRQRVAAGRSAVAGSAVDNGRSRCQSSLVHTLRDVLRGRVAWITEGNPGREASTPRQDTCRLLPWANCWSPCPAARRPPPGAWPTNPPWGCTR